MRIACAQIIVPDDPADATERCLRAVDEAAGSGARLIVLPEAALAPFGTDLRAAARENAAEFDARLTARAEELDVVVVAGSFVPADGDASEDRVLNRVIVRGRGTRVDYDKIHLFDAFGTWESATIAPGRALRTVDVDGLRIGLATCYDVRFPEQFQALADRGAQAVVLPAAWADGPGKAEQWRLLVRARALDATVHLIACDQAPPPVDPAPERGCGVSLVVSPLGEVRAELGREEGILLADIDAEEVAAVRRRLPVLEHRADLRG